MGSLEPSRGSLRTVETSDTGEPEIVEPRTTHLINEDIILRLEMVRTPQTEA